MPHFRSELPFAAFLKYSPYGKKRSSELSREVRSAIKNDGLLPTAFTERAIDYAAKRLREELHAHPFLAEYFGDDVTLVPVPRSKPRRKKSLWPSLRICEALRAQGLGHDISESLTRVTPIDKSATAASGRRPEPGEHYDTLEVKPSQLLFERPQSITLIDDFVTRGSTFLASVARIEEVYPDAIIRCFALVRSVGSEEVDRMLDPVLGSIAFDVSTARLRRTP